MEESLEEVPGTTPHGLSEQRQARIADLEHKRQVLTAGKQGKSSEVRGLDAPRALSRREELEIRRAELEEQYEQQEFGRMFSGNLPRSQERFGKRPLATPALRGPSTASAVVAIHASRGAPRIAGPPWHNQAEHLQTDARRHALRSQISPPRNPTTPYRGAVSAGAPSGSSPPMTTPVMTPYRKGSVFEV
jgi:hypothetical protein